LHQIAHVGVSPHTSPKLFGCEIIFEEFQPMWSRYLIVMDRRTDRRTTYDSNTARCTLVHRAVKTTNLAMPHVFACVCHGMWLLKSDCCCSFSCMKILQSHRQRRPWLTHCRKNYPLETAMFTFSRFILLSFDSFKEENADSVYFCPDVISSNGRGYDCCPLL